jgi:major vault protein
MQKAAQENELILAPGEYAYMQESTGGSIKAYVGPTVVNKSGQEFPVTYNHKKGFQRIAELESAVRPSAVAVQGFYMQLYNPTTDFKQDNPANLQPPKGASGKSSPDLVVGRKVNIPGPTTFALWPGQHAEVIRGHHLRSNQFLLVQVYDEEAARANWSTSIVHAQAQTTASDTDDTETEDESASLPNISAAATIPEDLSVGGLLLVKGTEVSFYIPPTGISVLTDERGSYVREALTLERLEYCILVDEDGNKRYERGPQVVFPRPTETFLMDEKQRKKFRALELNDIQGIYVKVIAPYTEEDGTLRVAGDEIFITGAQQRIYYPREEHAIVKYDGQSKHYATQITAGTARYILDRMSGEITTTPGPKMLLPDPRNKVFVRRALTEDQCNFWYPNNVEVREHNATLRALQSSAPTTRGAVSEGEYRRTKSKGGDRSASGRARSAGSTSPDTLFANSASLGERSNQGMAGDQIERGSTYTEPRSIQLGGKFDQVPVIKPFVGYALKVVSLTGKSRVVQYPEVALLNYDETLEVLSLSTGQHKSTGALKKTVYLRSQNNKVSDTVNLLTQDHVTIEVRLSYFVNFVNEPDKWFAVENYVQLLTDRVRSVLKSRVRQIKVAEFYADVHANVRDIILGTKGEDGKRAGLFFEANNMSVDDVDILSVNFQDQGIEELLSESQRSVVRSNIQVTDAKHQTEVSATLHRLKQAQIDIEDKTQQKIAEVAAGAASRVADKRVAEVKVGQTLATQDATLREKEAGAIEKTFQAELDRNKRTFDQRLTEMTAEHGLKLAEIQANTEAVVARFKESMPGFSAALEQLYEAETAAKVSQALSVQTLIGGESITEVVSGLFGDSKLGRFFQNTIVQDKTSAENRPNG